MINYDFWTSLLKRFIKSEIREIEKMSHGDLVDIFPGNTTQLSDSGQEKIAKGLGKLKRINMRINLKKPKKKSEWSRSAKRHKLIYHLARIAAAILIYCIVMMFWYFFNKQPNPPKPNTKVIIELCDGRQILLDNYKNGGEVQQGNTRVIFNNNTVSYCRTDIKPDSKQLFNRVITFDGGPFKIVLADGSIIMLNAASSIKLPVAFDDHERKVELSGEAFFKVKSIPVAGGSKKFTVAINNHLNPGMCIEVVGTAFNIKAYDDEEHVRTALLEGKIKICGESIVLKPGQEVQSLGNRHLVTNIVDTSEVNGWRNGELVYRKRPLKLILQDFARWHGLEIRFLGDFSKNYSLRINLETGYLSRLNALSEACEFRFNINNGVLVVSKKLPSM